MHCKFLSPTWAGARLFFCALILSQRTFTSSMLWIYIYYHPREYLCPRKGLRRGLHMWFIHDYNCLMKGFPPCNITYSSMNFQTRSPQSCIIRPSRSYELKGITWTGIKWSNCSCAMHFRLLQWKNIPRIGTFHKGRQSVLRTRIAVIKSINRE